MLKKVLTKTNAILKRTGMKNTMLSVDACLLTHAICMILFRNHPKKKNMMKVLPLSLISAFLWGRKLDYIEESNDLLNKSLRSANHIKLDELDDDEDEDFREI